MANKPDEANFFPDVPQFPSMGTFQPVYGKFDLTTYIQGASDYEIMAFLVGKYNACLEAYGTVTKLSSDTVTACKQLQDWINSWFTNLDVQEEINNKLNKMIEDGTISSLLSDIIIDTSAPEFVTSVSAMTNIKKVYVLSSDGHVYSYNGTAFIDTGLVYGEGRNVYSYNSALSPTSTLPIKLLQCTLLGSYGIVIPESSAVTDLPSSLYSQLPTNITLTNTRGYNGQFIIQTVYDQNLKSYSRMINADNGSVFKDWTTAPDYPYIFNEVLSPIASRPIALTRCTGLGSYGIVIPESSAVIDLPSSLYSQLPTNITLVNTKGYNGQFIIQTVYDQNLKSYSRMINADNGSVFKDWTTDDEVKKPIKYCSMGDSITHGANASTNYPTVVSALNNYELNNMSQSGSSFTTVRPSTFKDQYKNIDFSNYNLVTIAFGTNDYISSAPIGTEADTTNETVVGGLKLGIEKIRKDNPECLIYVITPLNLYGYGSAATNYALGYDNGNGTLQEYIDAITNYCNNNNVLTFNAQKVLTDKGINVVKLLPDSVHPNTKGQELIGLIYSKLF